MEIRVLGPFEVITGEHEAARLDPRQRELLALLLTEPRGMSRDRLSGLLLEDEGRKGTLRVHLRRLRGSLEPRTPARKSVIRSELENVRLAIPPGQVDAYRFRTLFAEGREALDTGDLRRASVRLRAGLELWRGPVLEDLPQRVNVPDFIALLDRERREARELLVEADLELGRHRQLLPELDSLVRERPGSVQLWCQFALAAYRAGRVEQAEEVCRDGLRELIRSGLDEGPLQKLQGQILERAPGIEAAGTAASPPAVPRPPLPPPDFTDRETVVATAAGQLQAGWDSERATVIVISGMAGIGKTATALQIAAHVRRWFPDGICYLDLHGLQSHALQPGAAIAELLRKLGVTSPPGSLSDRMSALRSELDGRRLLMILDNAASEAQVRPLLPDLGPCAAVVTSRVPLPDIEAASSHKLEVFGRPARPRRHADQLRNDARRPPRWCREGAGHVSRGRGDLRGPA